MRKHTKNSDLLYMHPVVTVLMLVFFVAAVMLVWRLAQSQPETTDSTVRRLPDPTVEAESVPGDTMEVEPSPAVEPAIEEVVAELDVPRAPRPSPDDEILSDVRRLLPGNVATEWLYYRHRTAQDVTVAGSWDAWRDRVPMQQVSRGLWAFYIGSVDTEFGSYEFKFVVDGEWESGENRVLHVNEEGLIERPPPVVAQTLIDSLHEFKILLYDDPETPEAVEVELTHSLGEVTLHWRVPEVDPSLAGYRMRHEDVEFVFDPAAYGLDTGAVRGAAVAGTFNGWNASGGDSQLSPDGEGMWSVRIPYGFVDGRTSGEEIMFKFVVNGEWLNPPEDAPNRMLEPGTTHENLQLPRGGAPRPQLIVETEEPVDLSNPPHLLVSGLHERRLRLQPTPGAILDTFSSDLPMGVTLDRENEQTTYRLFAPRASLVELGLFDGPYHVTAAGEQVEPAERVKMSRDEDGVWETTRDGLNSGQYYAFRVEGPQGHGEGFSPHTWKGDPYAYAVSLAEGNSIVVDLEETSDVWQGWSGAARSHRIPWEDMVIYETHVRHFTWDPSSGVPEHLRGTYMGFLATEGLGTGLDHLKELGVNVIQFMPIHEFPNGFVPRHDWGYATDFFFAPESSFALNPREGSQIHEFRHLVDELKQRGFSVFLDVVYNHIGGVNVFSRIDRKYYFRLNPDLTFMNFSGVGNDVASERYMMRRLIVESVLFWVEEYGIDGFRFDLGELIDDETLLEIERQIRAKHPHVVLHSEPWSFRGHHKDFIGGTTWGAWNDEFREPAKRFVVGHGDLHSIRRGIRGSVEGWARHPLQSVNYMESHDDHSLVDELTSNPGRDGRELTERDERVHKLAATLIFTSLGTPMITEGQDWLRSKHGIRNTYNRGDELNALRWTDRDRPHAREVSDYYAQIIRFRLSEAGRALRVSDLHSEDYVRFFETGDSRQLGWMVNANQERPGVPMVLVLMNTADAPASFDVDLPAGGVWRKVGDGDQVLAEGIPGADRIVGGRSTSFDVPARTALIFRSGF